MYDLAYWLEQLRLAEKWFKPWCHEAMAAEKNFRAESADDYEDIAKPLSYSVYWSSVETLKPAIFSGVPKVYVRRRRDSKNPVSKLASFVLENILNYQLEKAEVSPSFGRSRDDFLIAGRGQTWVRYDALQDLETGSLDESVIVDHVHWKDFLHNPSRAYIQSEIAWVARRNYLSKEEMKSRFQRDIVEPDYLPGNILSENEQYQKSEQAKILGKTVVYEVWCKTTGKVYWIAPSIKEILEESEPPINFVDFFPCPIPVYSSNSTASALPITDFRQISEHIKELNAVVQKQRSLRKALKFSAVYDASLDGINRLLSGDRDFELIPVENWVRFSQSGAFEGGIAWFPVDQAVALLGQLAGMEQQILGRIYEITSYSDIMRGASNPNETATAQSKKVGFANLRLNNKIKNFELFVRDTIKIMGEVVSEIFSDETIYMLGGVSDLAQADQALFPQVLQLLRQDFPRNWDINIETSDTAVVDESDAKAEASEFITTISNLVASVAPILETTPQIAPVFGETIKWAVRKYRAGRAFESQIEAAIDQLVTPKAPTEPAPPPPDPQMIKAQGQLQIEQQRLLLEQQKMESEIVLEREKLQNEILIMREKHIRDLDIEHEKVKANFQIEAQKNDMQAQLRIQEIQAEVNAQVSTIKAESEVELAKMRIKHDAELIALKEELKEKNARNLGQAYPARKRKVIFKTDDEGNRIAELLEELEDGSTNILATI